MLGTFSKQQQVITKHCRRLTFETWWRFANLIQGSFLMLQIFRQEIRWWKKPFILAESTDYTNSRCFIDLDRWFVDVGGLLEFGKSTAKIEEEHVTSIDLAQATHEYAWRQMVQISSLSLFRLLNPAALFFLVFAPISKFSRKALNTLLRNGHLSKIFHRLIDIMKMSHRFLSHHRQLYLG